VTDGQIQYSKRQPNLQFHGQFDNANLGACMRCPPESALMPLYRRTHARGVERHACLFIKLSVYCASRPVDLIIAGSRHTQYTAWMLTTGWAKNYKTFLITPMKNLAWPGLAWPYLQCIMDTL
jgi:hypothetical protein